MLRVIEDLAGDWRRLDERIEGLSSEIEVLVRRDAGCERLMSVGLYRSDWYSSLLSGLPLL
jgi:transposase